MTESRAWLIKVLVGPGPLEELIPGPFADVDDAIKAAAADQVLGLVAARMSDLPGVHPWAQKFAVCTRELIVRSLMRSEQIRSVLDQMSAVGLSPLLLKGGALAYWLYPQPWLRETADIDLLFGNAEDAKQAADVLNKFGYSGGNYFGDEAQETLFTRARSLEIDLHWGLVNSPLFSSRISFDELEEHAIRLSGLSEFARGLGSVHAIIHACIHRVINLHMKTGDQLKWLYDLHLMVPRLSEEEWVVLISLCRERELSGVCLSAFDALSMTFGTPLPQEVETLKRVALMEPLGRRHLHDWRYIQFKTFLGFPSWRQRWRWLYRRLFPSRAYLRSVYGEQLSTRALFTERVRRLLMRSG